MEQPGGTVIAGSASGYKSSGWSRGWAVPIRSGGGAGAMLPGEWATATLSQTGRFLWHTVLRGDPNSLCRQGQCTCPTADVSVSGPSLRIMGGGHR